MDQLTALACLLGFIALSGSVLLIGSCVYVLGLVTTAIYHWITKKAADHGNGSMRPR